MCRFPFVVSLLLIAVSGCGQKMSNVYPAQAVVRMDKEPFGPCTLLLIPTDGNRSVAGTVDASGKVVFTTYKNGDGAPAGEYKVAVRSGMMEAPPKPIPAEYQSESKTPLRMTITATGPNEAAFDLQSKSGSGGKGGDKMTDAFRSPDFAAGATKD